MATAEQRNHAKAFLKKAEEYLASAEDNLAAGRNTPAAGDAIHAGIVGNSASNARTCPSNGSNADGPLTREYFGGELDFTARETVSRDNPSRAAIARTDKPSLPCRYLI